MISIENLLGSTVNAQRTVVSRRYPAKVQSSSKINQACSKISDIKVLQNKSDRLFVSEKPDDKDMEMTDQ